MMRLEALDGQPMAKAACFPAVLGTPFLLCNHNCLTERSVQLDQQQYGDALPRL
jgi:hypothetical protein